MIPKCMAPRMNLLRDGADNLVSGGNARADSAALGPFKPKQ